jgi:hypothetical protein
MGSHEKKLFFFIRDSFFLYPIAGTSAGGTSKLLKGLLLVKILPNFIVDRWHLATQVGE